MVFAPFTWVLQGQTHWHGFVVLDNLPRATLFFGMAYLAFTIGCLAERKKKEKDRLVPSSPNLKDNPKLQESVRFLSWLFFVLGFLMSLAYLYYRGRSLLSALTLGQLGSFSEDLSANSSFWFLNQGTRILMSAGLLLLVFEKKKPWLAKLAYAVVFLLVLSSGQRNQLMGVVLTPIIYWFLTKKRRPKVHTILLVCACFVVVLGYVGLWRSSFFGDGDLALQGWDDVWSSFMVNIEVFFPYYTMLSTVPEAFPHQFGLSYLYTFIQFIPRFLWPGKPVSAATNVTIAMFGETWAGTGPAFPNFGEMYLDFGLLGMIIGMLIFGKLCQMMYRKVTEKTDATMSFISFSLFLPYLFQYITRGHFPSVMTEVVFLWGPIWAIRFFLKLKRNSNRVGVKKGRA